MKRTLRQNIMIAELASLAIDKLLEADFEGDMEDLKDALHDALEQVKEDLFGEVKKEVIKQNNEFGFFEVSND